MGVEECQALLEDGSTGKHLLRPGSAELGEASKRSSLGSTKNSASNLHAMS